MTHKNKSGRTNVQKGYQPRSDNVEGGYQPRAETPVDPTNLKPPRGDTAAEPPKKPETKDTK